MKILNNLLGEYAKIHGDSIYFESGSNARGHWVKLPDGTMVCYLGEASFKKVTNYFLQHSWVFPAEFIDSEIYVGFTYTSTQNIPIGRETTNGKTRTSVFCNYHSPSAAFTNESYNVDFALFAIGRWK